VNCNTYDFVNLFPINGKYYYLEKIVSTVPLKETLYEVSADAGPKATFPFTLNLLPHFGQSRKPGGGGSV
jgi:hypothetical protein